jgi:hypothetical protein
MLIQRAEAEVPSIGPPFFSQDAPALRLPPAQFIALATWAFLSSLFW